MLITQSESHRPGLTCSEVSKAQGRSSLKFARGNERGGVARGSSRNWEGDIGSGKRTGFCIRQSWV